MHRRFLMAPVLALTVLGLFGATIAIAGDTEPDTNQSSMTMALPQTHLLTLTLSEGGETFAFSMTVATRHFSMNLGEKSISLRGRMWQGEGDTQLLDYTLEFTQWVKGSENSRQRSGSTWNGSTHLTVGRPVEIATFLGGSFSLRLDAQDR